MLELFSQVSNKENKKIAQIAKNRQSQDQFSFLTTFPKASQMTIFASKLEVTI